MNCENALELMNRKLDEALTKEESAALQAHLDACPDCRETWRQLHELDALLQESELEPPAALHDGVMQAIRQEQKKKPRRVWLPAAAIAAAAAAIAAAGSQAGLRFFSRRIVCITLSCSAAGGSSSLSCRAASSSCSCAYVSRQSGQVSRWACSSARSCCVTAPSSSALISSSALSQFIARPPPVISSG